MEIRFHGWRIPNVYVISSGSCVPTTCRELLQLMSRLSCMTWKCDDLNMQVPMLHIGGNFNDIFRLPALYYNTYCLIMELFLKVQRFVRHVRKEGSKVSGYCPPAESSRQSSSQRSTRLRWFCFAKSSLLCDAAWIAFNAFQTKTIYFSRKDRKKGFPTFAWQTENLFWISITNCALGSN